MSDGVRHETASAPRAFDSPYVGLKPYEEDDSDRFFGRDADSAVIIGNLSATRLTVVYAGSGVGKSSLLRAGVAALVRTRAREEVAQDGAPRWLPVVFSDWTEDPVAGLVDAIAEAAHQVAPQAERLDLPRDDLRAAVERAAAALDTQLLIILDQFEEYLLYRTEHALGDEFADQLAHYVNVVDAHANVLIAIRDDFYSGVGDLFRGRIADVYANSLHIEFLDRAGGRDAILRPVYDLYNPAHPEQPIEIEDELVEAVLDQVHPDAIAEDRDRKGARSENDNGKLIQTTALQIVMSRLWRTELANGSHVLRRSTLDALGGAKAIAEEYFDEAMDRFEPPERDAAAAMFSLLVTSGGTKIARTFEELADASHLTSEQTRDLLRRLREMDILRRIALRDAASYEIRHDALARPIGIWRRRRIEQQRDEERRRERQKLAGAVAVAAVFLAVAVFAVFQYFTVRQQRIESQSKRLAANALEIPTLDVASLYALEAWRKHKTDDARRAVLSLASNQQLGRQLPGMDRVETVAISPTGGLIAAGSFDGDVRTWDLATHRPVGGRFGDRHGSVVDVAFGPRGSTLATGGADGAVRLWNVSDQTLIAKLPGKAPAKDAVPPGIQAVALNAGGTKLAAGLNDGTIQLWNVQRRRKIGKPLRAHRGPVSALSFNGDGTRLASASCFKSHLAFSPDHRIRLWNVRRRRPAGKPLRGNAEAVCDVAFSPDGKTLASAGDDDTVRLFEVASHEQKGKAMSHNGDAVAVAFSPDGKALLSAGRDRTLRLWNAVDQTPRTAPLSSNEAPVTDVAFSPSGKEFASSGLDAVRISSAASPRQLADPIRGGLLLSVAFSPDGRRLAWGGGKDIRIRDRARSARPVPHEPLRTIDPVAYHARGRAAGTRDDKWTGKPAKIGQRAVSRHRELRVEATTASFNNLALGGRFVAWASQIDSTVRVVDLVTRHEDVIVDPGKTIKGVALSRDGRTLAYSASVVVDEVPKKVDAGLRVWDVRRHRPMPRQPPVHPDEDHGIAFGRGGTLLAYGGDDRKVRVWDVAHGKLLATMRGHIDTIFGMAFSPDGNMLASSGRDARVILWDVDHRSEIGRPLLRQASIYSVAFSRDGKTLATGGTGGDLQLWDLETRRALGDPLAGHTSDVFSVAFSPRKNDPALASASGDGTVRLWNGYPVRFATGRLCSYIDKSRAEHEWKQSEPNVGFKKPCWEPFKWARLVSNQRPGM